MRRGEVDVRRESVVSAEKKGGRAKYKQEGDQRKKERERRRKRGDEREKGGRRNRSVPWLPRSSGEKEKAPLASRARARREKLSRRGAKDRKRR